MSSVPKFAAGTRVRLTGLGKAVEHNGKEGRVVGYQKERYEVKLDLEEEKTLAVKEVNLDEVVSVVDDGEEEATDDEKPRHEEEEQCPLCLDALTPEELDFNRSKTIRFACCGKTLCATCAENGQLEFCPLCRQRTPTTPEESLAYVRKHIARGRPWALHEMGERYAFGNHGLPKNDKLAFEWYQKAANKGHPRACHEVAWVWHGRAVDAGYALS